VLGAGEAGGGALRPHQLGPEQVGAAFQLLAHLATEARHLRGKTRYRKLQSSIEIVSLIQIWICIFLGLPDLHPDPLITSRDLTPDPDPSLFS
jgi:hypothetical protein